MTDKEHIIINGKKQYCKILFRCKHINDLKAYDMIRNGIKITPENAPVDDFDLMLIENTDSPFGFSSVCKRNSKENVWEYSGFGHSGACSIVTALLKQLARKTQELDKYKQSLDEKNKFLQDLGISASGEFKRIKFYIESLKNKYNENARYRKALDEIESICLEDVHTFADGTELRYDSLDDILDIINNAKGEEDKQ